jgi:starvation-inducible DNA-binding protein
VQDAHGATRSPNTTTSQDPAMYHSPSRLSEKPRRKIGEALNNVLADGLDLHMQIKVAHWNIKGPHFAALHPLFETFAVALAAFNDAVAERAVTLGALAFGTARHVAKHSRLDEYPQETTKDLDHVQLLAERFEVYLDSVREARAAAAKHEDEDTVDLLTGIVEEFEKHAWFLRATLDT